MLSGWQALLSGEVLSDRRELMKILVALISIACVGGGGLMLFGLLSRAFDETYGVDEVGC